jgi:hypothetical protein
MAIETQMKTMTKPKKKRNKINRAKPMSNAGKEWIHRMFKE